MNREKKDITYIAMMCIVIFIFVVGDNKNDDGKKISCDCENKGEACMMMMAFSMV